METNYAKQPVPPRAAGAPTQAASDAATGRPAAGSPRIEEFKNEIASLELKTPADANERWFLLGGIVSMAVGFALIIFGYIGASGTVAVGLQMPYLISGGLLGLGFIVLGAALFVRFSLSRYLRFWLIREIYEQRAQNDRLVESLTSIETLLQAATRPRPKGQ
jgi:hypothetical protein